MLYNSVDFFILVGKLFSILSLFLITIFIGYYPFKHKNFKFNKHILSAADAFASGIFLSISLLNLLPSAQKQINQQFINQEQDIKDFPWAYLTCLISYSLMLILERILMLSNSIERYIDLDKTVEQIMNNLALQQQKNNQFNQSNSQIIDDNTDNSFFKENENNANNSNNFKVQNISSYQQGSSIESQIFQKSSQIDDSSQIRRNSSLEQQQQNVFIIDSSMDDSQILNKNTMNEQIKLNKKIIKTIFYQLFVRSIFHGFAIGMEEDAFQLIYLLLTIILCKWYETLTFSKDLLQSQQKKQVSIQYLVIYSFITPLALAVSWFISSLGQASQGFTTAFVSGGFIYIATSDLLIEAFSIKMKVYKLRKLLMYLLSICLVTFLWFAERKIKQSLG